MKIQKLALGALLMGTTMGVAQAQTEAGKLLLNGRVNYSQSKNEFNSISGSNLGNADEKRKSHTVGFSPQVGYFVVDNLVVGVALGFGTDKSTTSRTDYYLNPVSINYSETTTTYKNLNVGPFVRYYKMISEKTGFYGQLAGGYQRQLQKYSRHDFGSNTVDYDNESKTTGGYGSLVPGFVFFPTKKLGLDLTIGDLSYFKNKSKSQNVPADQGGYEGKNSGFAGNFGIQYLTVGASLHL